MQLALLQSSLRARIVRIVCMLFATALCMGPSFAQVPAPFEGTWKATWQTDKRSYEAEMKVTSSGGLWQTAVHYRSNPCAGREVPMKVESASERSVQFLLQFSEVIAGCQNVVVVLNLNPDGTVTGTRSSYELTLTRK